MSGCDFKRRAVEACEAEYWVSGGLYKLVAKACQRRIEALPECECIAQLSQKVTELERENTELRSTIARLKGGMEGACYACEPVAKLNEDLTQRLEKQEKYVRFLEHEMDCMNGDAEYGN